MARKEPQGGATARPICNQCNGSRGRWVDKVAVDGKGKRESHKMWEACRRCGGSGWL